MNHATSLRPSGYEQRDAICRDQKRHGTEHPALSSDDVDPIKPHPLSAGAGSRGYVARPCLPTPARIPGACDRDRSALVVPGKGVCFRVGDFVSSAFHAIRWSVAGPFPFSQRTAIG